MNSHPLILVDAPMLSAVSSRRIRDAQLVMRPASRIVRVHDQPATRDATRIEALLTAGVFCLTLALLWLGWQWLAERADAKDGRENLAISWGFADKVLFDLKQQREESAALQKHRDELIGDLQEAQRQGDALQSLLGQWQQAHGELTAEIQLKQQEWSNYSDQLEHTLGRTRVELTNTSEHLQQERASAQAQISDLNQTKTQLEQKAGNLEREADALDRKASSLSAENHSLSSEVGHLRSNVSSLQSERNSLASENSSLRSQNSSLAGEVSCLKSRICSLESELRSAQSRCREDSHNDAHRR